MLNNKSKFIKNRLNQDALYYDQKIREEKLKEQEIIDRLKSDYINLASNHKK